MHNAKIMIALSKDFCL